GSLIPSLSATNGVPSPTAVSMLDTAVPGVQWMGIAFDDGETITYDATGAILQGPENIDLYLAHAITYPGGRTIPVTRDELHRRIAASPDQKAILWAADLNSQFEGA